eukprot:47527-Eustigmatos_ZCMA.PRE.1
MDAPLGLPPSPPDMPVYVVLARCTCAMETSHRVWHPHIASASPSVRRPRRTADPAASSAQVYATV